MRQAGAWLFISRVTFPNNAKRYDSFLHALRNESAKGFPGTARPSRNTSYETSVGAEVSGAATRSVSHSSSMMVKRLMVHASVRHTNGTSLLKLVPFVRHTASIRPTPINPQAAGLPEDFPGDIFGGIGENRAAADPKYAGSEDAFDLLKPTSWNRRTLSAGESHGATSCVKPTATFAWRSQVPACDQNPGPRRAPQALAFPRLSRREFWLSRLKSHVGTPPDTMR